MDFLSRNRVNRVSSHGWLYLIRGNGYLTTGPPSHDAFRIVPILRLYSDSTNESLVTRILLSKSNDENIPLSSIYCFITHVVLKRSEEVYEYLVKIECR